MSNNYDALHVFGAVMRWDSANGRWTFPLILEPEEYSGRLVLGEWRAQAAVVLQDEASVILVTGGSNIHPVTGKLHSRAIELANLIVEKGLPHEKVVPIGVIGASHTLGNVANLTSYLKEHHEVRRIGMVCPRFQMLRAMVMQYRDTYCAEHGIQLEWLEVERTLVEAGVLTKAEVDAIYSMPEADFCWRKEQEGMQKLLEGSYQTQRSA